MRNDPGKLSEHVKKDFRLSFKALGKFLAVVVIVLGLATGIQQISGWTYPEVGLLLVIMAAYFVLIILFSSLSSWASLKITNKLKDLIHFYKNAKNMPLKIADFGKKSLSSNSIKVSYKKFLGRSTKLCVAMNLVLKT